MQRRRRQQQSLNQRRRRPAGVHDGPREARVRRQAQGGQLRRLVRASWGVCKERKVWAERRGGWWTEGRRGRVAWESVRGTGGRPRGRGSGEKRGRVGSVFYTEENEQDNRPKQRATHGRVHAHPVSSRWRVPRGEHVICSAEPGLPPHPPKNARPKYSIQYTAAYI